MFQLSIQDIHLNAVADSKQNAIKQVAAALAKAGSVSADYVNGMLAREQQTSTYLGNGIAIPHGTTDTRGLVLHTGVQVFQYPQGIAWAEGQTAYIVIGIAARSDEHLALLRQLTHVLSDESLTSQMAKATSVDELQSLLMGEKTVTELIFDTSMITTNIETTHLLTLQAINIGKLQQVGAISPSFVSEAINHKPLALGQGIWLTDCAQGHLFSAVAVSRPAQTFNLDGESVSLLLTLSIADEQPLPLLNRLSELLLSGQADKLHQADAATLITLLTEPLDNTLSAEFVIYNEHGLHARPCTALVNTIKQFNSEITVINLDGSGKPASGRSLMKIISLGVKKGHRLRFIAKGDDAQAALEAIGLSISDGLGETS